MFSDTNVRGGLGYRPRAIMIRSIKRSSYAPVLHGVTQFYLPAATHTFYIYTRKAWHKYYTRNELLNIAAHLPTLEGWKSEPNYLPGVWRWISELHDWTCTWVGTCVNQLSFDVCQVELKSKSNKFPRHFKLILSPFQIQIKFTMQTVGIG